MAEAVRTTIDFRESARGRVLLHGELVWGQGAFTADCAIRDLSTTGARVRLGAAQAVPNRVHLLLPREPVAYEALIAWKNMPDFGLRFVLAHSLDEDCAPALSYLRRLWVERRNR